MKRLVLCALIALAGCTENSRAKNFGGSAEYDLPAGEKLVVATWKDSDLWLLTRKRAEGETPETYYFREKSSFGVWEGTYVIRER